MRLDARLDDPLRLSAGRASPRCHDSDACSHARLVARVPSRVPVRWLSTAPVLPSTASMPPTSRQGRRPRRRFRPTASNVPKRLRTTRPPGRHRSAHLALAWLASRPRPFVRHTAPQRFDDEARRAAALRSPSANPVPRRSLGGVQLPDGAPGGDRALAVGGMPLSVLCSRFDCQRAPFDHRAGSRRRGRAPWPSDEAPAPKERVLVSRAVRTPCLSTRLAFAQTSARLVSSPAPFDPTRTPVFRRALLDVAADLGPARPSPTPRTTRHLRRPERLPHQPVRTPRRRTNPASSGTTSRHPRSWSPRSLVSQGSQRLSAQALGTASQAAAPRSHGSRPPKPSGGSTQLDVSRAHSRWFEPEPRGWPAPRPGGLTCWSTSPKEGSPACPTSRVTLPGGTAQMIHATPPTWRPLAPWIDPRIAAPDTSLSPREDVTTRKQW